MALRSELYPVEFLAICVTSHNARIFIVIVKWK